MEALAYLEAAISEYQALAQANGFEDITLEAYQINTGDYTGQMMVVIQGPTPQRLGAFLDSRNENWGQSLKSNSKIKISEKRIYHELAKLLREIVIFYI